MPMRKSFSRRNVRFSNFANHLIPDSRLFRVALLLSRPGLFPFPMKKMRRFKRKTSLLRCSPFSFFPLPLPVDVIFCQLTVFPPIFFLSNSPPSPSKRPFPPLPVRSCHFPGGLLPVLFADTVFMSLLSPYELSIFPCNSNAQNPTATTQVRSPHLLLRTFGLRS